MKKIKSQEILKSRIFRYASASVQSVNVAIHCKYCQTYQYVFLLIFTSSNNRKRLKNSMKPLHTLVIFFILYLFKNKCISSLSFKSFFSMKIYFAPFAHLVNLDTSPCALNHNNNHRIFFLSSHKVGVCRLRQKCFIRL